MAGSRPFAVVTGVCGGIGMDVARQFAGHDLGVLVTAEDGELAAAAGRRPGGGVSEPRERG